jgi:hypothetical protein
VGGPQRTAPPPPCVGALVGAACIPHGGRKAMAYSDTIGFHATEIPRATPSPSGRHGRTLRAARARARWEARRSAPAHRAEPAPPAAAPQLCTYRSTAPTWAPAARSGRTRGRCGLLCLPRWTRALWAFAALGGAAWTGPHSYLRIPQLRLQGTPVGLRPKRTAPPPPCAAALAQQPCAACIPHGGCEATAYSDTHWYDATTRLRLPAAMPQTACPRSGLAQAYSSSEMCGQRTGALRG